MDDILAQVFFHLDGNILLISIMFIIGVNLFIPGSLVIVFFVGMYGFFLGAIYSVCILLLSSTIIYVLLNRYNLNLSDYIKNEKIRNSLENKREMSTKIHFLIRLISLPYLVQNLICSMTQASYIKYLAVNFISLIPWVIAFGLFSQAMRELKFELALVSLLLICLSILLPKRYLDKFI